MNYTGYFKDSDGNRYYPNVIKITTGVKFETGRIIDGKKEYGKRVNVGYLKTGYTEIAHGISNIYAFTGYEGYFVNENSGTFFTIPRSYPTDQAKYGIDLACTKTNIILTCGTNYTGITFIGYITLYYIET
jgi:hypothetical protein